MKKNILAIILLLGSNLLAIEPPVSKATGIFLAFGVGPRLPLNHFASSTDLGYGLNIEVSYTDNEYLPIFLFASAGFEQYPGAQSFYQETDYSNFSTSAIPVNIGARYYFGPLLEQVVLLIPIVELSASYTFIRELHEFKSESNRNNYEDELGKFGISAGAGLSMFIMEIMAAYHYLENNQYVSVDLKVRIPLFINF